MLSVTSSQPIFDRSTGSAGAAATGLGRFATLRRCQAAKPAAAAAGRMMKCGMPGNTPSRPRITATGIQVL